MTSSRLTLATLARTLGVLASVGTLTLYTTFVWANPYSPGMLTLPIMLMMLFAGVGMWAAWAGRPYLMAAVALGLFVPMGLYMLGTPGLFRWIGVFNLVFFLAAVLMFVDRFKGHTTRTVA